MENNLKEIKEFISQWKDRAINYYTDKITFYHKEYRRMNSEHANFHNNRYSIMKEQNWTDEQYREEYKKREEEYKNLKLQMAEDITKRFAQDIYWYRLEECLERMKKAINKDAELKEKMLVARVNKAVGTIVKAIELNVGVNGELNGYIKGENGTCKIETIYAGGYNIQCLHYRVLVKRF